MAHCAHCRIPLVYREEQPAPEGVMRLHVVAAHRRCPHCFALYVVEQATCEQCLPEARRQTFLRLNEAWTSHEARCIRRLEGVAKPA